MPSKAADSRVFPVPLNAYSRTNGLLWGLLLGFDGQLRSEAPGEFKQIGVGESRSSRLCLQAGEEVL